MKGRQFIMTFSRTLNELPQYPAAQHNQW